MKSCSTFDIYQNLLIENIDAFYAFLFNIEKIRNVKRLNIDDSIHVTCRHGFGYIMVDNGSFNIAVTINNLFQLRRYNKFHILFEQTYYSKFEQLYPRLIGKTPWKPFFEKLLFTYV